ncbi:MAG: ABC transporter permease [Thermoplasmata archaeon]|jgi:peptide/nickel transport system permease protein|nr:ABC transporter permease [Thermoplasmata archaeon]MVT12671.1 ABC transporter permease subunit [Euryarchaeota archaeon]MVT14629.1 ABC transporter permease subunit [Euryarchaeota archaeon]MVT35474.1 ABC transporter permease subunit [Euryarchaeota archaeon]
MFDKMSDSWKPRIENFKITMKILLKSPASAIGLIIVLVYFIIALLDQVDPYILGITTNVNTLIPNYVNTAPQPPSWLTNPWDFSLPFGTTYPGINLYDGIIKAIRIDIAFSLFVVVSGAIIGIVLGVFSAFYGGWFDEIIMRLTDIFFSIPYLVLVIALGVFLGRSLEILSIGLIILWWPIYARVVRGQALSIKEQTYVEAARASGVKNSRIIFRHILPNTMAPIFVQFSFDLATIVLALATLYFIGFAPSNSWLPELGFLSSIGYEYAIVGDWWTIVFPGFALMIFALGMNLLGDGLRDALDPRLRR